MASPRPHPCPTPLLSPSFKLLTSEWSHKPIPIASNYPRGGTGVTNLFYADSPSLTQFLSDTVDLHQFSVSLLSPITIGGFPSEGRFGVDALCKESGGSMCAASRTQTVGDHNNPKKRKSDSREVEGEEERVKRGKTDYGGTTKVNNIYLHDADGRHSPGPSNTDGHEHHPDKREIDPPYPNATSPPSGKQEILDTRREESADVEKFRSPKEDACHDETLYLIAGILCVRPTTREYFDGLKVQQKLIKRLKELSEKERRYEDDLEMAELVYLLKLLSPSNPMLETFGKKAGKGAMMLLEGDRIMTEGRDLLRSAITDISNSAG